MTDAVPPSRPEPGSVENPKLAAGVLLWTGSPDAPRFLLLRNARHRSWGFAKGHLEPGESPLDGALREVAEETGYALTGDALVEGYADTHAYRPLGTFWKRVVHFLAAGPVDADALTASSEHDRSAWCGEDEALERLDHEELKRAVVRAADALARASAG